ncbi:MAG: peptidylprolyl isomerase [Azoarcus sp.]|jgi:peptidyl-prolyl cis-trans isomerase C|nr:peptidylprolyl isomerase [Azoarcus sp.]
MKLLPSRLSAVLAVSALALAGCAGDNVANAGSSTSKPEVAAKAESTVKPAVTVNGVAVPGDYAEALIASYRAQGAPDDENLRENVRKDLIRRQVLEQAAVKAGVDKRPDIQIKQDVVRQTVLIQDYLQDWAKSNPPTDEELKKEYDEIKTRMASSKEYHVRHILLKTEPEAKAVITRLGKGAKFAELAKKSLDQGSRDRGGDLGWADPSSFVPPFSEAVIDLGKGKYTKTPVKTDFGYHVILLEDSRNMQAPSFEDIKVQLQQSLQNRKLQGHIEQLEQTAEVK